MKNIIIENTFGLYEENFDNIGAHLYTVIDTDIVARSSNHYKWMKLHDQSVLKKQSYLVLEETPAFYPCDYLIIKNTNYLMGVIEKDGIPLSLDILTNEVIADRDKGVNSSVFFNNTEYILLDSFQYKYKNQESWRFLWRYEDQECLILDLITAGERKYIISKGVFLYEGDIKENK